MKKNTNRPSVHISPDGVHSVDVNELFWSDTVQTTLERLRNMTEKQSKKIEATQAKGIFKLFSEVLNPELYNLFSVVADTEVMTLSVTDGFQLALYRTSWEGKPFECSFDSASIKDSIGILIKHGFTLSEDAITVSTDKVNLTIKSESRRRYDYDAIFRNTIIIPKAVVKRKDILGFLGGKSNLIRFTNTGGNPRIELETGEMLPLQTISDGPFNVKVKRSLLRNAIAAMTSKELELYLGDRTAPIGVTGNGFYYILAAHM